jgi:hypothetical protein
MTLTGPLQRKHPVSKPWLLSFGAFARGVGNGLLGAGLKRWISEKQVSDRRIGSKGGDGIPIKLKVGLSS